LENSGSDWNKSLHDRRNFVLLQNPDRTLELFNTRNMASTSTHTDFNSVFSIR
jgi:hypothetical protein